MQSISIWLTNSQVSCWNFQEQHLKRLKESFPQSTILLCQNKKEFASSLPAAETAIIWRFQQEWFLRAKKLKLLVTPAAGKDYFQVTPPPGVKIAYSTFHGPLMAETVLGMMLAHARGLTILPELLTREPWPRGELDRVMRPLKGSLATILGFGRIGQHIARLLKGLGVKVYGVKRQSMPLPPYFQEGDQIVPFKNWREILPETDHLILCLPRLPETDNLLNSKTISLLPSHAAIYNVGRGNAVDEEALMSALYQGKIAAAYLDVFQQEPLEENSPLRLCPHLFIMPHASSISPNYLDLFLDEFIERYQGFITGKTEQISSS